MATKMTVVDAVQRLWGIAVSTRVVGEDQRTKRDLDAGSMPSPAMLDGFYLRWERGWGIDAKLTVGARVENGAPVLVVRVGWSSTEFSPEGAVAAAELHREVSALACWLQATAKSLPSLGA